VSVTLDSQLPGERVARPLQKVSAQVGAFAAAAFTEVAAGATGQGLLIEDLSKSGTCFYIADNEGVTSPPSRHRVRRVGRCFGDGSIALPTAGNAGNAGAHIVASGGTIATTAWYSTW